MANRLIYVALVVFIFNFSCIEHQPNNTKANANWQLFIDNYWCASRKNVTTTLHQPTKHPDNPLIRGEVPWAQNPYCFGSVIYDVEESLFKIWYMS